MNFELWNGTIEVGGSAITATELLNLDLTKVERIYLAPKNKKRENGHVESSEDVTEYIITVKSYMTKKSTVDFDFMKRWNDDNPMPLRTMVGTKIKETNGMVYMALHGDIIAKVIPTCMKCGKPITNKVSQYFGMGPECGGHRYVNPFDTDEQLQSAVQSYREHLRTLVWEGWIPKSAITLQSVKEK